MDLRQRISPASRLLPRLAAVGGALWLGAAAPKTSPASTSLLSVTLADAGPLSASPAMAMMARTPVAKPAGLEPAPMPNPDLDAPLAASGGSARLSPALLSQHKIFAGNGYANSSSQEESAEDRRQPAAGLNLSVPVK